LREQAITISRFAVGLISAMRFL